MRMRNDVLSQLREHPDMIPQESLHGWRSAPDDGRSTHCWNCGELVLIGDPVVGTYLEYVSIVFCPACVLDNCGLFWNWMGRDPLEGESV